MKVKSKNRTEGTFSLSPFIDGSNRNVFINTFLFEHKSAIDSARYRKRVQITKLKLFIKIFSI